MSALLQHNGQSHANSLQVEQGLKFNEQVSSADPAWHWVTPADRLQAYKNREALINETKLEVLEKD